MFTLTIFGFGPENGSTKGTLGMKFEPERLAFGHSSTKRGQIKIKLYRRNNHAGMFI